MLQVYIIYIYTTPIIDNDGDGDDDDDDGNIKYVPGAFRS